MTSLGEDCYVGTLNYKELVPPILIGVDNLQQTCDIGNTTDTDVVLSGASATLSLDGTSGPKISYANEDIRIVKATEFKNISIGFDVGTANDNNAVEIGSNIPNCGGECVSIGHDIATGVIAQGKFSVAIGKSAGNNTQGSSCIAIGTNAGATGQGTGTIPAVEAIAIGANAGAEEQGTSSVAIGANAGSAGQKVACVAIGLKAGSTSQQDGAIAVGQGAGASLQGIQAIAIGYNCCPDTQGKGSIALGSVGLAFPPNCIGISAGGTVLSPALTLTPSCFINPIRGATNPAGGVANSLWYDTVTKEVCYHIP